MSSHTSNIQKCVTAKGDSAASAHYWREEDIACLTEIQTAPGPAVTLPNNTTIRATKQGNIPINATLSSRAKNVVILPSLKSASLISLGQLCDDNCKVLLDKHKLYAVKKNTLVLQGDRNKDDGLWDIKIPYYDVYKKTLQTDNYHQPTTHAAMYTASHHTTRTTTTTSPSKNPRQNSTIKKSTFLDIFKNLEALISTNECAYHVNNALKIDRISNTSPSNYVKATITTPSMSVILRKNETKSDLVNFHHGALFSPVKSTLIRAIKNGHLATWPGLDSKVVHRHLHPSIHTEQGHLNQQRQKLQSTRQTALPSDHNDVIKTRLRKLLEKRKEGDTLHDTLQTEIMDDAFPAAASKTQDVMYAITNPHREGKAYADLTGRFPYRSSRGNEYILVAYHYDSNAILATAIKNRQAATITSAWKNLNSQFAKAGAQPTTYIMDNEASTDLKDALQEEQIEHQLVPPHNHRTNLAERAIQTFKAHFKAGLASLDPDFPLREWDRLIKQAVTTLCLLRSARANPNLSAYAYLFGQFDYNATPLVPPGTKVLAHDKPSKRATWGPNGEEGWTIGPSPEHYRCIKCFFHQQEQKET